MMDLTDIEINHATRHSLPSTRPYRISQVQSEVARFVYNETTKESKYATWLARMLEHVTDKSFKAWDFYKGRKNGTFVTPDDVINGFIQERDEATSVMITEWDEGRNDANFRRWYPCIKIGSDGPIGHMWGDEVVALAEKVINAHPYWVWTVYETVTNAARKAAEDAVGEFILGDDHYPHVDLHDSIDRAFDEAVKELVAHFQK